METVVSGYVSSVLPNGTTATTQAANDNSTKVATTAYADAAGAGGAFVELGHVQGDGASATLSFTSIPATSRDLYLDFDLRATVSAAGTGGYIKINSDGTQANYSSTQVSVANGASMSATTVSASATNGGWFCTVIAATATADVPTHGTLTINNYAGGFWKKYTVTTGDTSGAAGTGERLVIGTGAWHSTAAITRIDLVAEDGTAFTTTSRATLYGLGSA